MDGWNIVLSFLVLVALEFEMKLKMRTERDRWGFRDWARSLYNVEG